MTEVTIPEKLISVLKQAGHVVIMTGAGISAQSGVPTFREAQTGLWARYDPQQLATPGAFRRDPALVWNWYEWRRELVNQAQPNAGHRALVALENRLPHFTLITQNIDNLHRQAGSRQIIELHGNIQRTKCFDNDHPVDSWPPTEEPPPPCPQCGSLLRPDVVWFGESLPVIGLQQAMKETQRCDVFFSIGTSGLVQPAASLAYEARRQGAQIVEINLRPTPLTPDTHFALHGPAGQILPALAARL